MLSQVFHDIEKKIILSLKENPKQTPETLETSTNLLGKGINLPGIVAHLTKAVQELEARLATLEG